jgi:hypothetical protein
VRPIHAPKKAFVTIRGGGPFAPFLESDEFLPELVTRVRVLATGP